MKKRMIGLIVFIFIVSGCSFSVDYGGNKSKKDSKDEEITLYLTNVDAEDGVTLEDDTYKSLNEMIKNEKNLGYENDFSVFTIEPIQMSDGTFMLFLIGVNRLPDTIENVRFNLTIKNEQDEYIYEDSYVHIGDEVGEFPSNGVKPFLIEATEEQIKLLQAMDLNESVLEISDFKFD